MRHHTKFLLAASAATLLFACAKKAEEAAPASEAAPAAEAAAPEAQPSEPIVEAVRAKPVGYAKVTIGIISDALRFTYSESGFCNPNGSCGGGGGGNPQGISGDIDLSTFPPGDVTVTVTLGDDAYNAGYRFPSDGYQAIGIATWPAGAATEPPDLLPLFGEAEWPTTEFQPPAVTGDLRSVTFLDEESAEDAYEYAVAVDGPGGRTILDPRITNGGGNK